MKRIFLSLILILLISFSLSAQTFSLSLPNGLALNNGDTVTVVNTNADASFSVNVWITNNALVYKDVKARKTVINLVNGAFDTFCWFECYPPETTLSPDSIRIDSKATAKAFLGDYESHNNAGKSAVRYTFFDVNNPSDTISVIIEYHAGSGLSAKDLKSTYKISNAYPNPANQVFNLDYKFADSQTARIEVLNVTGSLLLSQVLINSESKQTFDVSTLKSGVYFYNIIVDDKKVSSKKLIIQH
jgi:hypothetical protein